MLNKLLVLFIILFGFESYAQQNAEYMGTIKLNDTSYISYKIAFELENDSISGYSLTDLGGSHETKSIVKGTYNTDTKEFKFHEENIIYTKSPIVQDDFCFVHFSGKVRDVHDIEEIEGSFEGRYTDGEKCIDGEIRMASIQKLIKKAEKLDKKIQRTNKVEAEVKEKINLVKSLDTLSMNIIANDENLNILTKDQVVEFTIFDAGKEDGDMIDLIINGEHYFKDFTVTKEKKVITLKLKEKQTKIEVVALNVGTSAPNTVKIQFKDSRNFVSTLTNLKEGEKAAVTIVKQ